MARILLMEDEEDQSLLFAQAMENMAHDVTCALSGMEALELLKAGSFDLLVTDIFVRQDGVLVNDGGLALVSRVRNQMQNGPHARLRDLPILVISGGIRLPGQANLLRVATSVGANAALGKPVDFDHLHDVLDALLTGGPIPAVPPT